MSDYSVVFVVAGVVVECDGCGGYVFKMSDELEQSLLLAAVASPRCCYALALYMVTPTPYRFERQNYTHNTSGDGEGAWLIICGKVCYRVLL